MPPCDLLAVGNRKPKKGLDTGFEGIPGEEAGGKSSDRSFPALERPGSERCCEKALDFHVDNTYPQWRLGLGAHRFKLAFPIGEEDAREKVQDGSRLRRGPGMRLPDMDRQAGPVGVHFR